MESKHWSRSRNTFGESRLKACSEARYSRMFTTRGSDVEIVPVTFGIRSYFRPPTRVQLYRQQLARAFEYLRICCLLANGQSRLSNNPVVSGLNSEGTGSYRTGGGESHTLAGNEGD